jgi:gliding motility-associated-like protein
MTKRMMKIWKVCSLVILVLLTQLALAQKTTTGSGDWNNAGTWNPAGVPGTNDDVTIAAGHDITVAADANCRTMTLNGTVDMSGATNTTLAITAAYTDCLILNAGGEITIGETNILSFSSTQSSRIVNNGGSINSGGTNGSNGGTILVNASSGNSFEVQGSAQTVVNNLEFTGNANFRINSGGLFINGMITVPNNQWSSSGSTLSPIYGPASTLYINNNSQGLHSGGATVLGGNFSKMWAISTGTIGVTEGYPNNVIVANLGTSMANEDGTGYGWAPNSAIGLNGYLQLGDGTNDAFVTFNNVTSFNTGGVIVENGSIFKGPGTGVDFNNSGDFILAGASTGTFTNNGAVMNMNGSGTEADPQVIASSGGLVNFSDIEISNGTYVELQDPLAILNSLTLTNGYIGSSSTNTLTINNGDVNAISGGGSSAFIDGPLSWAVGATTSDTYTFPVGKVSGGPTYLPLDITPNSESGSTVTVEAFNVGSGGAFDETVSAISSTEYWSVATSSAFTSGASVTATRPTGIGNSNALAAASNSTGIYTAIGGLVSGGNSIAGGGISSTPAFIAMVEAPLSAVKAGGSNVTCDGTLGTLIAGGSGGNPPYSFSLDGGGFNAVNLPNTTFTFTDVAAGTHEVTVRDDDGTEATTTMNVLGSVQIENGEDSVEACPGESLTLTAVNLQNASPNFIWSSSPSGSPVLSSSDSYTINSVNAGEETVYVLSDLYVENLLVNGSFESGNSGFTSTYSYYTGGQYATTPGNDGFYSISNAGTNQCQYFSITGGANQQSLAAQDGSQYFIADGATYSSVVYEQTVNGLTAGETYRFQFWYAAGNPDATRAQLRINIDGGNMGTLTFTDPTQWTQQSYDFSATGTSATITFTNLTATGSTNGNDFFLDNMELLEPCSVMDEIKIVGTCPCSDPGAITLSPNNPDAQCGGSVSLTASAAGDPPTGGFNYEFFKDGVSLQSAGTSNTYDATESGVYTVMVTDPASPGTCFGVSSGSTVTIDADPTSADAGEGVTICSGDDSPTLTGNTPSNGTGEWVSNGNATADSPNSETTTLSGLEVGNNSFTWQISSGSCTASTDEVIVVVTDLPNVEVSGANAVCSGESVALTASGADSYTWDNSLGTGETVNPSPTTETTYIVTGTVGTCENTAQITVSVNELPTATISGTTGICEGESASLTIEFTGTGTFDVDVLQSTQPYLNLTSLNDPHQFTVTEEGDYTLANISDANCAGTELSGTATVSFRDSVIAAASLECRDVNSGLAIDEFQIRVTVSQGEEGSVEINELTGVGVEFTDLGNGVWLSDAIQEDNSVDISVIDQYACGDGYNIRGLQQQCSCPASGTIGFTPPTTVCPGETADLEITFSTTSGSGPFNVVVTSPVSGPATYSSASSPLSIPVSEVGSYSATIEDVGNTCTVSAAGSSVILSNHDLPTAQISGGGTICEGESEELQLTFTGTELFSVDLMNGGTMVQSISGLSTNDVVSVTNEGVYSLSNLMDANCSGTDVSGSATIAFRDTVIAEAELECDDINSALAEDEFQIRVTMIQGDAGSGLISDLTSAGVTFTETTSGEWVSSAISEVLSIDLGVSDQYGCDGEFVIRDLQRTCSCPTQADAQITGESIICSGETSELTVSFSGGVGPFNLTLTTPTQDEPTQSNVSSPVTLNISEEGTYRVTIENEGDDCEARVSGIVLAQHTTPTATISGADTVCANGSDLGEIQIDFTGTAPFSFNYSDGTNSVVDASATNQLTLDVNAGTYILESLTDANCSGTVSGTGEVTEVALPSPAIIGSDASICEGDEIVSLTASNISAGNSYEWYLDGDATGVINTGIQISSTTESGEYTVMEESKYCGSIESTESIDVTVLAKPFVDAGAAPEPFFAGESTFLNGTSNGINFIWSPSVFIYSPTSLSTEIMPTESQYFYLEASNSQCKSVDSVWVTVVEPIVIPNTFTPNGDGFNDVWQITGLETYPSASVRVFNRWGNELYTNFGTYEEWEGTFNGKELPVGTYYYVINLFMEGLPEYTGFVELMR